MTYILIITIVLLLLVCYCGFTTSQGVERNRQAIQDLINDIEDSTRHME